MKWEVISNCYFDGGDEGGDGDALLHYCGRV